MSRKWYLAALVPLVIGVAVGLLSITRLMGAIEDMPRMMVPGSHAFALAADDYVVYGESKSVVDGQAIVNERFNVRCVLKDASGAPLALTAHAGSARYAIGSYAGESLFDFTLPAAGTVTLACEMNDGKAVLAIGGGIGLSIVIGVVSTVLGFIAAIITLVVVRKRRKRYLELVAARDNT
jgi:hypothetical protein